MQNTTFLTNFEDQFGLHPLIIVLDPNMCAPWYICVLASSQTLVVNWQNYSFYIIPLY